MNTIERVCSNGIKLTCVPKETKDQAYRINNVTLSDQSAIAELVTTQFPRAWAVSGPENSSFYIYWNSENANALQETLLSLGRVNPKHIQACELAPQSPLLVITCPSVQRTEVAKIFLTYTRCMGRVAPPAVTFPDATHVHVYGLRFKPEQMLPNIVKQIEALQFTPAAT